MPVTVVCPSCGKRYSSVAERIVGSRGKCEQCHAAYVAAAYCEPAETAIPVAEIHNDEPLDVVMAEQTTFLDLLRQIPSWVCFLAWTVATTVVFLVLAYFSPWLTLVIGVGGAVAGSAYYSSQAVREHADRLLRFDPQAAVANRLAVGASLFASLLLFACSAAVVVKVRKMKSANRQLVAAVQDARQAMEAKRWDEAESVLGEALDNPRATDTADAVALLFRVQEGRSQEAVARRAQHAAGLLQQAENAVAKKDIATALDLLQEYLAHPHGQERERASDLLREAEAATSSAAAVSALVRATDEEFARWSATRELPASCKLNNATLAAIFERTLRENTAAAVKRREEERLARLEQQRREERERLARLEREQEEAKRRPRESGTGEEDKWYEGGTLHKARMSEWHNASYRNRLATSADFVAKALEFKGKTTSMSDLKTRAAELEKAISEAGRGGVADKRDVSEIAAALLILMGYR